MPISNGANTPLNKISPGLPDMEVALLNWFLPMTFTRLVKDVVDFNVVETGIEVNFRGVWQPLKGQDLMIKPEGQRDFKWFRVHSDISLILNPDEIILYQGTQYRVKSKFDYKEYKYIEYHLVEDYVGAGPELPLGDFQLSGTAGDGQVEVEWTPSTGVLYYTLKYGTAPGVYDTIVSTEAQSPATITGLTNDTPYYFMVVARNSVNAKNADAELELTPEAP